MRQTLAWMFKLKQIEHHETTMCMRLIWHNAYLGDYWPLGETLYAKGQQPIDLNSIGKPLTYIKIKYIGDFNDRLQFM